MGMLKTQQLSLQKDKILSWTKYGSQGLALAIILMVATGLYFYQLGTESIWIDEHFSIRDAENLKIGTRPLYYGLLHIWMKWGQSDSWLRGLSIPFSLGSLLLTYHLGRRLISAPVGILAAFLMTLSPLFVGYAQQIRMYSLSTFLGLGGTLILSHILQEPKKIRPLMVMAWMGVRLLAVMTTPLNLLLLLPDTLLLFWKFRHNRKVMLVFGIGLVLAGMLWLPFAQVLAEAGPRFMGGWVMNQPKPDIVLIPAMLTGVTVFWPLGDLPELAQLSWTWGNWGWDETVMLYYMGFTGLAVLILALGLVQLIPKHRYLSQQQQHLWWISAWAFLPTLIIAVVSIFSGSIWRERYLIFIVPYFLILLAVGFIQLWRQYQPIAVTVAIIYGIAVTGGLWHYYTTLYHDDWRGIAEVIETQEQPGDIIGFYAADWEPHLSIPRYYQGNAAFHVMQQEPLPRNPQKTKPFITTMLQELPPTSSQYWLVVYEPWSGGMKKIAQVIDQQFDVIDYQTFPNSVNAAIEVFQVSPKR